MGATPTDRNSAFTQVASLLQQQKLTRTNSQEPVKGFTFVTRNDKKRLLELLSIAKSVDFCGWVDLNGLAVKLNRAYGVSGLAKCIISRRQRETIIDSRSRCRHVAREYLSSTTYA